MTKIVRLFVGTFLLTIMISCNQSPQTELTKEPLIPYPATVNSAKGSFELSEKTKIFVQAASKEVQHVGQSLSELLSPATGFTFEVEETDAVPEQGIYIGLSEDLNNFGDEGYELIIGKDLITIRAYKPAGLFYGVQTLRQLLPVEIENNTPQKKSWTIPAGTITDYPRFGFRGSMLDVSRHFFGKEDIKKYIDHLAALKMNVLHLHLSDDQGWRIEIKSWPKLTEVGGITAVDGDEGGFYTQDDYAELVKYAKDRFITIIPEIDMPGHTNAALASYAELNCDGKKRELYTGTEVGFSTFCTRKELTYDFVDSVIRELAAITPGPYIHIGGDESLVTEKEDYIYFVNRVQKIVKKYGKQMIGWEEIAQADLQSNSIAQHWDNTEYPIKAKEQGVKILMSPASKIYLDMQYDSTTHLGLHWAGYIEVDAAYNWDPSTIVEGVDEEDIIGIEAPLWSETLVEMADIEYMMFPRILGYAEIGWSPADSRNWENYSVRLGQYGKRLKEMEINFYPSEKVVWTE